MVGRVGRPVLIDVVAVGISGRGGSLLEGAGQWHGLRRDSWQTDVRGTRRGGGGREVGGLREFLVVYK